jgi:hypothetical protein
MKKYALVLAFASLFATSAAIADPVNFDSTNPRTAPTPDVGWTYDQIDAVNTDSLFSHYIGAFANPTYFRITDYFNTGDQYKVYDFGTLVLTTGYTPRSSVLPIGDPSGDAGWTNISFQTGELLLGAGAHDISIQGDGVGGVPAGFYVRFDTVPEPATLGLLALGGLALIRRMR